MHKNGKNMQFFFSFDIDIARIFLRRAKIVIGKQIFAASSDEGAEVAALTAQRLFFDFVGG